MSIAAAMFIGLQDMLLLCRVHAEGSPIVSVCQLQLVVANRNCSVVVPDFLRINRLCAADRDYHFTTKQQLLSDVRGKKFLEAARVSVHSRPCTSSTAAAAAAPPQPLSYWYGTSLATVREVAATGKLCIMSLDVQGAQVRWRLWHVASMPL